MSRKHHRLNKRLWARTRVQAFERDSYRCTSCLKAGALECDHVTPLEREPGQDPYDLDGLQTLCRGCHIEKSRREARRTPTHEELVWRAMVEEMMD